MRKERKEEDESTYFLVRLSHQMNYILYRKIQKQSSKNLSCYFSLLFKYTGFANAFVIEMGKNLKKERKGRRLCMNVI